MLASRSPGAVFFFHVCNPVLAIFYAQRSKHLCYLERKHLNRSRALFNLFEFLSAENKTERCVCVCMCCVRKIFEPQTSHRAVSIREPGGVSFHEAMTMLLERLKNSPLRRILGSSNFRVKML